MFHESVASVIKRFQIVGGACMCGGGGGGPQGFQWVKVFSGLVPRLEGVGWCSSSIPGTHFFLKQTLLCLLQFTKYQLPLIAAEL